MNSIFLRQVWLRFLGAGLLAMLVAGCGLASEPNTVINPAGVVSASGAPVHIEPSDLALGAQIFSENCTACHGPQGLGDGPSVQSGAIPSIVNLTDPATLTLIDVQDYFEVISLGRLEKFMPPWDGVLTEDERWAVAFYVYGLRGAVPSVNAPATVLDVPSSVESAALPEVSGTISGTLTQGTAGFSVPEGLSVALQAMSLDFQEVDFRMTTANAGHYAFADVPMRADRMYVVTAIHQARVFSSALISGDPSVATVDAPLTLYEVTDDPSVVEINLFVTRIEQAEDEIVITQVVNFHNTSDRLFARQNAAAGRDESGSLRLPEGAAVLNEAELNRCCVIENGLLIDNEPLLPGDDHMFRVVYALPDSTPFTLPFTFDFRVSNQLELMLTPGMFDVQESVFASRGSQQYSTGIYDVYLADAPMPGERIDVQLSDIKTSPDIAAGLASLFAVAGGGLMAAAVVLFFRFRTPAVGECERLLGQIATLDERHRAGHISDVRYQRDRARLKAALTDALSSEQQTAANI